MSLLSHKRPQWFWKEPFTAITTFMKRCKNKIRQLCERSKTWERLVYDIKSSNSVFGLKLLLTMFNKIQRKSLSNLTVRWGNLYFPSISNFFYRSLWALHLAWAIQGEEAKSWNRPTPNEKFTSREENREKEELSSQAFPSYGLYVHRRTLEDM